jgi:hypothetical protein
MIKIRINMKEGPMNSILKKAILKDTRDLKTCRQQTNSVKRKTKHWKI